MTRPRQIRHFKVQHKPDTRTEECQTDGTNMVHASVQCNLAVEQVDEDEPEEDEGGTDDDNDPEWLPFPSDSDPDDFTSVTSEGDILRDDGGPRERKFLIFESCLLQLLMVCWQCFGPCRVAVKKVLGSFVLLRAQCKNGHIREWGNQPFIKGMPLGNLLTAAATLFSGSRPSTTLNMFHHLKLQMISLRTYFMIQSAYLCPAVKTVWTAENNRLLIERRGKLVKLGGDGRCCSAGHTAKYGAYSLMDLETSTIIDTQLVQSSEVKNSGAMELEGLRRCLKHLDEQKVEVAQLVTDRHTQVKKHMREYHAGVKHHFDVWHMAKGVKKKLEAVGKKKGLECVARWACSISNHMYWCAATSGGHGPLVQEKWLSILNHICDIHEHDGELFLKCEHGQLEDREWLGQGSRALRNIEEVISKKAFLKDLQKLAPNQQTSSLESFHNIICMFASKHDHYFFEAMESRLQIAALHYNENSNRRQAETKLGLPKYGVTYGKANHGNPVVKEIKVPMTFTYVEKLTEAVISRRENLPSYKTANSHKSTQSIPPVADRYQHHDKQSVLDRHASRFNRK